MQAPWCRTPGAVTWLWHIHRLRAPLEESARRIHRGRVLVEDMVHVA